MCRRLPAGTALSAYIYRPPTILIAATLVFLVAAAFWTRNRLRLAQIFTLLTERKAPFRGQGARATLA